MKYIKVLLLGLLFSVSPVEPLSSQETEKWGDIIVHIDGFRNTRGGIGVLLFNSPDGFAGKKNKAYRIYYSTLTVSNYSTEFNEVEFGTYAVTAFHDENFNHELDTNWLGIPREGVGVSGEVKGMFGPRFRHSAFSVDKSTVKVNIQMKYLR